MEKIGGVRLGKAEALLNELGPAEQPVCAALLSRWQGGTEFWGSPTAILTTHRLLITKNKLFGQPKIDQELPLALVAGTGSGAVPSFGTWGVKVAMMDTRVGEVQVDGGPEYLMYFSDTQHALVFEQRLDAAVKSAQERMLSDLEHSDETI